MKRILAAASLWLILGAGATLFAFKAPNNRTIPNFDKRWADHPKSAELSPAKQSAAGRLRELVPGVRVDVDRVRHAPNFVASSSDFLSGPQGRGKGVSAVAAQSIPSDDPHHPIKAF